MYEQVLAILRSCPDYLSGQELSIRLGVSRTAVWKAVNRLRSQGYEIHSVPNRGYRLVQSTRALCREEILAALPKDFPWRDSLRCFDCIDSTNTRGKALAAAGAPAGTVLIADRQTGGRGRMGRSFHSPGGMGIYLSAILRPVCTPGELMHLTCAVAVAMCDAVESVTGLRPGIKWTNDLVIGKKKLAGILTELALEAETQQVQYAVVGIGINCCQMVSDFPEPIQGTATSLACETGAAPDRNRLAAAMMQSLCEMNAVLLSKKREMMDTYRRDCVTTGHPVSILRGEEIRHGKALTIDDNGGLVVEYDTGEIATVASGEVSVRGMYGYV